jgi:transketolase
MDVAILSCGVMVEQSLEAAADLSKEGIESTVVDMHTIKPLDDTLLDRLSEECGCLVTAEDHSVIGGLGSAVSEWLSLNRPIPLEMVGVADRFGESGDSDDLMRIMGLTSAEIFGAAKRSIDRRNTVP